MARRRVVEALRRERELLEAEWPGRGAWMERYPAMALTQELIAREMDRALTQLEEVPEDHA